MVQYSPPALLLRFLTDLELACKTKAFDVHKLVISSISQYFREILAKDPSMKRLELPSLSPLGTPSNSKRASPIYVKPKLYK